ncbi:hypothetical protein [Chitinophaga niabensis]|jgi:hypothetical protein|uniref:Uncharacterized protein n=1 Tax=Chitinophaga niabensis TaxID=536979 RepID=A0A1N6FMX1_9BACT|nr:hypothetical protein [Chitinophaga niabensis]SIN96582.1 hypothetical protein SAMN04488055_2308 [Chitinophaga niabensis]
MSNAKISKKARIVLSNSQVSAAIAKAIVASEMKSGVSGRNLSVTIDAEKKINVRLNS